MFYIFYNIHIKLLNINIELLNMNIKLFNIKIFIDFCNLSHAILVMPRALILDVKHYLDVLYQRCLNHECHWGENDPILGVTSFHKIYRNIFKRLLLN